MKLGVYKLSVLFLFLAMSKLGVSQEVKVSAVLDSSKMRVGEQVKLDLYVTYNANQKDIHIQWPSIGDTLTGKVEVVSVSPIDTTFPDKSNSAKLFQHQQIIISAYDSGYFAIPPFEFIVNKDSSRPLYTENFLLEVHTVPTDTSMTKVKDIKPPFEEKFNWRWYSNYLYLGLAFLLVLILVVVVTRYLTKRRQQVVAEPEKPKIPAHVTALAALEKIREEQQWKEGQVKEYYSSISDTVRLYIEERFNMNTLESTTDEIMLAFRSQVVDPVSKEKLQQLLSLSDLVKFAKQFPIENEHLFTLQNAFDFVNGTKREEEVTLVEDAENNTANIPAAGTVDAKTGMKNDRPVADRLETAAPQKSDAFAKVDLRSKISPLDAAPKKKSLGYRIAWVAAAIASFVVTFLIVNFLFFSKPSFETVMLAASEEVNKTCPRMVDNITRLDNTSCPSAKTFQYNYTLVGASAGQMDVEGLKNRMEPNLVNDVRTNPQLELQRENGITMQYSYKDKDGQFLFMIKVGPEDYENKN